jgi:predicted NBD/HSP70 family sugar kinase
MAINIGWNVYLEMILNSKLYKDKKGFAGEFGHICIFSNMLLQKNGMPGSSITPLLWKKLTRD